VLSGRSRVIDVSSFIAGATAPESTEFEYSLRPPFALHAATNVTPATTATRTHPLRALSMNLLLA
jgi:hypothetical protein